LSANPRPLDKQLAQAATFSDVRSILTANGRQGTTIDLVDGTSVLVDIPDITTVPQFNSSGKKISDDYHLLFPDIKAFEGKTKDVLDKFLQDKALNAARKAGIQSDENTAKGKPTSSPVQYQSPDIATGAMLVTFKDDASKTITDNSTIVKINFIGPRPKNVD
jgi:hypothetical protein